MISQRLTRDDIYLADEAFFTGTAAEVTPIRELGNDIVIADRRSSRTHARIERRRDKFVLLDMSLSLIHI